MSSVVRYSLVLLGLCLPFCVHAADADRLLIDGVPDEPAWREARVFRDFVTTEPLSRAPARLRQEARLLALPEGLAVAFTVSQPADLPRNKPATLRDQVGSSDRVNFMVDFDGTGRGAYEFTLSLGGGIEDGTITQENQFNTDWDAEWQHAVHETADGWTAELLLPWSITAMQKRPGATRTIAVYFDRVLAGSSERFAYPAASYKQSRFVSDFAKIDIPQFDASVTRVFPYVSVLSDQVNEQTDYRAGVDLFWKPSSDFQLTATVNPDFGQVESDDLVIDFSAIETFYSDKRPFFTENQTPFQLSTPEDGELIYTRRIGGPDDKDREAADIDLAVKLNGSASGFEYAYLGALERDYDDDLGRAFNALRGRWSDGATSLGYLITDVDRPYRERHATVNALDFDQRFGTTWRVLGQAIASDIDEAGERHSDTGGWATLQYQPSRAWQHELELLHFGDELDFNDMGYQKRPGLNHARFGSNYYVQDIPATSLESDVEWQFDLTWQGNDQGRRLPGKLEVQRNTQWRAGGHSAVEVWQDTPGIDDRISRGHGDWQRGARTSVFVDYESARIGDWLFYAGLWRYEEGLSKPFWQLESAVRYYISDRFNMRLGLIPRYSQDWLIWQQDNEFARYQRHQYNTSYEINWFPADRHELRLKAQWLAIETSGGRAYVLEDERMRATGAAAENFTMNNLGLQIRYRYAIAPLSDLYLVYSRGGSDALDESHDSAGALFEDAWRLRDSDQFFVKLRYRL